MHSHCSCFSVPVCRKFSVPAIIYRPLTQSVEMIVALCSQIFVDGEVTVRLMEGERDKVLLIRCSWLDQVKLEHNHNYHHVS